jgi:hypothetical protein
VLSNAGDRQAERRRFRAVTVATAHPRQNRGAAMDTNLPRYAPAEACMLRWPSVSQSATEGPMVLVRLLARIVGVRTADMLVHEVL